MKKVIPIVLVLLGLLVMVGAYFFVIRKSDEEVVDEEDTSAMIDVSLDDRPVASLTPRSDGHWLDMEIVKLGRFDAASMDYELLYKTGEGITQGVPGNILLKGQNSIERELLMGSESSGKFRYDEGVETGTLSLKFRNEKGRLIAKFTTDFHIQTDTNEFTMTDESFTFTLEDISPEYFVTMGTFGLPDGYEGNVAEGPYGVFTSDEVVGGEVSLTGWIQVWSGGEWSTIEDVSSTGIFISSN